jgi:hypothetical protein
MKMENSVCYIFIGKWFTYLPMKMEQTECSETSAYKIQTPGNYPEENIHLHRQVGELLAYEDGTDRVFQNVGI